MCDVSKDEEIAQLFDQLKARYGKLHALVHSVAFAPPDELKGDFVNTTREGFRMAHDVSVYSLIAVCRAAASLMQDGGSVITMTYYGAEKVVPHYNVMGVAKAALECTVRYLAQDLGRKKIRVNAISAGPVKTLAARGISGFGDMLHSHAERAPLQRNVEVLLGATVGCATSRDESRLGRLLHLLGPGMLVLLDRAFDASAFLAEVAATGAMLLARGYVRPAARRCWNICPTARTCRTWTACGCGSSRRTWP